MFLGLSVVEHFFKLNIETSESNREQVYLLTKGLLINNKFVLTINFTYLIINSLLCFNLPSWYNYRFYKCIIYHNYNIFNQIIFVVEVIYLIYLIRCIF